jgi:hypothetical protein
MVEYWNIGILEEGTLGRDERLLVQGTQTRLATAWQARAPPRAGIPSPPILSAGDVFA